MGATAISGHFAYEFHLWAHLHWLNYCIALGFAPEDLEDLVHLSVNNDTSGRNSTTPMQGCLDYNHYFGQLEVIRPLWFKEDWTTTTTTTTGLEGQNSLTPFKCS